MKGLYLIPVFLLSTFPQAKAQVDPAVHKICASVTDYMGCVEANSNKPSEENSTAAIIPKSAKNCAEKVYRDYINKSGLHSAEKNLNALLEICRAANTLNKRVNTPDKQQLKRGLKDFGTAAYHHYLTGQKSSKSFEIETAIKFSACMQGFAKSKSFLMPSSFTSQWRYMPDESWDKWFRACTWYSHPDVYSSGGLNLIPYRDNPSKQIAFDFVGAKNVILKGRRGRYVRFVASDRVRYSGYTISGQKGYADCSWGSSYGYYGGSSSGYCIAEEGTKDRVIPDSVRDQMWEFTVDCVDKTFDRNKDNKDWSSVKSSWTARKGYNVLCPLINDLPVAQS